MSTEPSVLPETWNDPEKCPFCLAELSDPGAGFVAHVDESPVCEAGFDTWRERVSGDVSGGWSG